MINIKGEKGESADLHNKFIACIDGKLDGDINKNTGPGKEIG